MSDRLNRHYRDHLFWLYPLLFLGLAIYAIMADKNDIKTKKQASSHTEFNNAIIHKIELVDTLQSSDGVQRSTSLDVYWKIQEILKTIDILVNGSWTDNLFKHASFWSGLIISIKVAMWDLTNLWYIPDVKRLFCHVFPQKMVQNW